jgi:hypothetical protein
VEAVPVNPDHPNPHQNPQKWPLLPLLRTLSIFLYLIIPTPTRSFFALHLQLSEHVYSRLFDSFTGEV